MPTPVTSARQCLTHDAASALDDAVSVARRRGHGQTTSLHMVSSLLSMPNSMLREACTRARNSAYSARVQFKALELSLTVSLDRLPSSSQSGSKPHEPPLSNSLMAAIKRSQANQRRQPENFTYYQQQQQSSTCVPVVRVELRNLILSILDDPLVSRVFGEAGFRSCDVKMAMIRPRMGGSDGGVLHARHVYRGFRFPFTGCGYSGVGGDELRRIGEVMLRGKGDKRNPLLIGVGAGDALRSFVEVVERRRMGVGGLLSERLSGLSVVCVKDEVLRFASGECGEEKLRLRFEEVGEMMESGGGCGGVVVNFGDFEALAGDGGVGVDGLRCLVGMLARLVEAHGGRLWLIGSLATYEVYFKILNRFPSIEKDLRLEILPVTSVRFPVGGSYPRSSLMESFVPLGGFFSVPPEIRSPSSNARQYAVRCHLCNQKYEQEVAALSKGGICASVAEQYQSSSPSWMQAAEPSTHNGSASMKGKDDRLLLSAKIKRLQEKWDSICQQHHYNPTISKGYAHQLGYRIPRVLGFQVSEDRKENQSNEGNHHSSKSSTEQENRKNASSSLSTDIQRSSPSKEVNDSLGNDQLPKSSEVQSESGSKPGGLRSHHFNSLSVASINDGHTSPSSVTSVTTDLGLGTFSELKPSKSSSSLDNHSHHSIVKDAKSLYKALVERVGGQEEAISAIIQVITRPGPRLTGPHGVSRGDIWINFAGPDVHGKQTLGVALAETLYGSLESFIYVDLSFEEQTALTATAFNGRVMNKYELSMRGTVVDYLAEKLSKKPSVVFLENIDKADVIVQNSLFQAMKTGKFADLRGKEVNISNCLFLGTTTTRSSSEGGQSLSNGKAFNRYSETEILRAKGNLIQMLVRYDLNDDLMGEKNKRKLVYPSQSTDQCGQSEVAKRAHKKSNSYLDLNLPAEGSEIYDACSGGSSDSDSASEKSRSWLEGYEAQIDQVVDFDPLDFDALAEKLYKRMSECLHKIVGSECCLEIEPKVMQQILAAGYLFGNDRVHDWIQQVVTQGFVEAMGKFSLNGCSIVKLVTCDQRTTSEEQPKGLLLPARIVVN